MPDSSHELPDAGIKDEGIPLAIAGAHGRSAGRLALFLLSALPV